MTHVQAQSIPALLKGRDVLGAARTGKDAASWSILCLEPDSTMQCILVTQSYPYLFSRVCD